MSERPINVGEGERLAAATLAVVLLASSLRVTRPVGLIVAGCLIYRALSGHCYGYEWFGASTCKLQR